MRRLGIETSDDTSSVAVVCDGRLQAEDSFCSRLVLCDELTPRILRILDGDLEIDGIAVSSGPGSFTGLRIGVTTAKALGHALEVPVVGVPTQHILAMGCGAEADSVAVVQRARVGHVCAGIYAVKDDTVEDLVSVQLVAHEQLYELIRDANLVVGNGLPEAAEADERLGELNVAGVPCGLAQASVALKLARWPAQYSFEQVAGLRPEYILQSQAERTHGIRID